MMFEILQKDHARLQFGGKGRAYNKVQNVSPTLDNIHHPQNLFPGISNPVFRKEAIRNYKTESVFVDRAPRTKIDTHIAMYMPESVTTGYSTQYTDTEIGFITSAGIDAYEKFAQGNIRGGLEEIGARNQDLARALNAMMLTTNLVTLSRLWFGDPQLK